MDERTVTPQIELPSDLQPQNVEIINGQPLPRGTVDEFAQAVYGKPLTEIKPWPQGPGGLILAVEKFLLPAGKCYRLIWQGRGEKWLAAEDGRGYSTRTRAIVAGYELAAELGAFFDEGWK